VGSRPSEPSRIARSLGWAAIALSVVLLAVFSAIRVAHLGREPSQLDAFGLRYLEHPGIALLHVLPGLLYVLLGPLQFVARIRARRIALHRGLGRILVACGLATGAFAIVAAFRIPAYGGWMTQAATVFFGAIFLCSLAKGFVHIRRREVAAHREWMIRAFALGIGVATIRTVIALVTAVTSLTFEEVFGAAFWIGFGINLAVAESWIHHTRAPRRTSGR
jgi:uncharacterized membrane protein